MERDTLTNPHRHKRRPPFLSGYSMSAIGLSALADMLLGTDVLGFGRGLFFYRPFIWECVLQVALSVGSKP